MCSVSSVIEETSTNKPNPDYCSYESTSSPLTLPSWTHISPYLLSKLVRYLDLREILEHVGKYTVFKEILKLH